MTKYVFIFMLIVFISSCSCVKKPGPTLTIDDKWKVWLPDSAATYTMESSNGLSESYQGGTKPTESNGSYVNQKNILVCEEGDTEFTYIRYKSSINNYDLQIRISAGIHTQELSIMDFQDLYIVWDLVNDKSISASTRTRTFDVSKLELDSLEINGHFFHNVWQFTITQPTTLAEHEARTLYIAQHYGLVKYEEEGGVIWERK